LGVSARRAPAAERRKTDSSGRTKLNRLLESLHGLTKSVSNGKAASVMRDGSYCEPLGLDYAAMRAKTTKEKVIVAAWAIGEGAVYYAVFYWLVGMSIRLDISLAGICLLVSFTLAEVRHNRGSV
jgi:hypothetical protein